MLFCLNLQNAWSQTEVRGIETRRVIYDGPVYTVNYVLSAASSCKYYGWEFYNANSIPVSVDIELWSQATSVGADNQIVKTQSIILKPGEKYIFKREEHISTKVDRGELRDSKDYPISQYYVKYKAYKLE